VLTFPVNVKGQDASEEAEALAPVFSGWNWFGKPDSIRSSLFSSVHSAVKVAGETYHNGKIVEPDCVFIDASYIANGTEYEFPELSAGVQRQIAQKYSKKIDEKKRRSR
jgi:hypothetical protein